MLVDDFVMLGKGVPEPHHDGRLCICSAGVSSQHGLIRVNPIAMRDTPKRWSVSAIDLSRDPKDTRDESWRITNDEPFEYANKNFEITKSCYPTTQRYDLIEPFFVQGKSEANIRRMSLAIIDFYDWELYFKENDKYAPEARLFDGSKTNVRCRFHPRLRFTDELGDRQDMRIRDWGAFIWMDRWKNKRNSELAQCLHLDKARTLLIGNMVARQNVWMVISVLPVN
jgi:hypothetical protein